MNPHGVPAEMRARRQWVIWRTELRGGRPTKVPYQARVGRVRASSTDPATWGTFEQALVLLERPGVDGLGFVFSAGDPYTGVDLDRCLGRGGPDRRAIAVVVRLNSYTEVSQSETGLHVIVRASLGGGRRNGRVEVYDRGRFFCMTGEPLSRRLPASPMPRQAELDELVASLRRPARSLPPRVSDSPITSDDQELLRRACTARNGAQVSRLWSGDWSGYPSQSEADLALCTHLNFWAGGDAARVDALFRRSGLYREKWERPDYRERTLALALGLGYGGAA